MYCSFSKLRSFSFCFPFISFAVTLLSLFGAPCFLDACSVAIVHKMQIRWTNSKCNFRFRLFFSLSRCVLCVSLTACRAPYWECGFAHIPSNTMKQYQHKPPSHVAHFWMVLKNMTVSFRIVQANKSKRRIKISVGCRRRRNRIASHEQVNKYNRCYKYNGMKSSHSLLWNNTYCIGFCCCRCFCI